MIHTKTALTSLHQRYASHYASKQAQPMTEYISGWDAPCYVGRPTAGQIAWEAVAQLPEIDFAGVEQALEIHLDGGVKDFYTTYFAGDLYVRFRERPLVLLQVIHPEDGERLLKNLIGHIMMKQQLEQTVTLFIGLTDEDDLMLTVNNETGAIGLEYVGKDQHEILAGDMETFLDALEPVFVDESTLSD